MRNILKSLRVQDYFFGVVVLQILQFCALCLLGSLNHQTQNSVVRIEALLTEWEIYEAQE